MNNVIFTKFGDSDPCCDIGDMWMQCNNPAKAEAEWKEAEKYRWHDLRKDSDDLPEKHEDEEGASDDVLVMVSSEDFPIVAYIDLESRVWEESLEGAVLKNFFGDVIAWKYIEPFEK